MKLKVVDIAKSTNEYYRNKFEKSGHKMDLYPAMDVGVKTPDHPSQTPSPEFQQK